MSGYFSLRNGLGFLLSLFLCFYTTAFSQDNPEIQFEKLCLNFIERDSSSSRSSLLEFIKSHEDKRLATLGHYLIGHQDLQNDRLDSALITLNKALKHSKLVPIGDLISYEQATVLDKLNEPRAALKAWQNFLETFPQSRLARKSIHKLWKNALLLNQPKIILEYQQTFPHFSKSPKATYYLGLAHESLNDQRQALKHFKRLYYMFPASSEGLLVKKKLEYFRKSFPELEYKVPQHWQEIRAEKLFKSKQYKEALEATIVLLQLFPSTKNSQKFQLYMGISQFHQGMNVDSIKTLQGLRSGSKYEAQAWFYRAENYRRLGDFPSFKVTVESFQQFYPQSFWLKKALFSIGNYLLVKRKLAQANHFYQEIINNFSKGPIVTNAHWRVCWYHYRQRNFLRTNELFFEHLQRFPSSPHRPSALYWSARHQELSGQLYVAKLLYRTITKAFSNHYYAKLSHKRLARLKPFRPSQTNQSHWIKFLTTEEKRITRHHYIKIPQLYYKPQYSPRVRSLVSIKLFQLAAHELLYRRKKSSKILFQAATLFNHSGNFSSSTYYLRTLFPDYVNRPLESLPTQVWQMFYPVKYEKIFFREAKKYDLDPYLLIALARQESALNPQALSPAKAHGIMQLLFSTAKLVAGQLNLQQPSSEALYHPDLNIRLGTKYLTDRLRQFKENVDAALASYNAGPHRIILWQSEGNYLEPAEFVENIPFTETRNYVKIIHRNYWVYKKLYGQKLWKKYPNNYFE